MASSLKFIATGQARIHHTVRQPQHPASLKLIELIRGSDVAFVNYEASLALDSSSGGHPSKPATMEDLKWMGFNLLSLANNHAFEGGSDGVIHTRETARKLGFTPAGTGASLEEATQASILEIQGVRIALLAMDSANFQTRGSIAGQDQQAGINPLRATRVQDEREYELNTEDVERNLAAVRDAASKADYVFVSFHEHFWPGEFKEVVHLPAWPKDWLPIREWKRTFAHQLIDAGATAVLSHGVPRAAAVEMYRGSPIFYSLGNFIFHSLAAASWPMNEVWNGFVVKAELRDGKMQDIRLLPIALADAQGVREVPTLSRHYSLLLDGDEGRKVLERVAAESQALGIELSIVGNEALLVT